MKLTNYPYSTDIKDNSVFLVDGPDGTKQLQGIDILYAITGRGTDKASVHRSVFRGKNLGTSVTSAQLAAIRNGSFDDIWVGDYWTINGRVWRVADINYWAGMSTTNLGATNHVVLMPDNHIATCAVSTAEASVPYGVSTNVVRYLCYLSEKSISDASVQNQVSSYSGTVRYQIEQDFGNGVLLAHNVYVTTALSGGKPIEKKYQTYYVDVPNEMMMFGCYIYANSLPDASLSTTEPRQLALFKVAPQYIGTCVLKDVVSATMYAAVQNGMPVAIKSTNKSIAQGLNAYVRPYVVVGVKEGA